MMRRLYPKSILVGLFLASLVLAPTAYAQTTWGITSNLSSSANVNWVRAMGGTSPAEADMTLDSVTIWIDSTHNNQFRLAVYQGGDLATGPDGAGLIEDLGETTGADINVWFKIDSVSNPSLSASTATWVVLKANSGVKGEYSTSSSDAGDYQSARGAYLSDVVSQQSSTAYPNPWPADTGDFGNVWMAVYLTYSTGAPTAPPKLTLLGIGP